MSVAVISGALYQGTTSVVPHNRGNRIWALAPALFSLDGEEVSGGFGRGRALHAALKRTQGLKPHVVYAIYGTTKVVP
jgi:hypothetical protein